jgi:hypothetical protein
MLQSEHLEALVRRKLFDLFLSQPTLNWLYDKAESFNANGNNPRLQSFIDGMGICPKATMEDGVVHDAPMSLGRVLERAFFISCGCCLFARGVFLGGTVGGVLASLTLVTIYWILK